LLLFIEQFGRLRCELGTGAEGNKLFCAFEVLQSGLGITAVSQCVSGFADGVCRLLVRDHCDQFRVLDDVGRVLCPLDSERDG
jgi:hypothetical protein